MKTQTEGATGHRRGFFYRAATFALGGLGGLVLGVPGVAYVLSPLLKRGEPKSDAGDTGGTFYPLARLSDLEVGVPRNFPVRAERVDAWVKYPVEPIGSVWLVRQPAGAAEPVVAFSSECPHLGCGVNVSADKKSFACPCHNSAFTLEGTPENSVPPRPMDRLDVELTEGDDPTVRVRFLRFRTQSERKIPLA